ENLTSVRHGAYLTGLIFRACAPVCEHKQRRCILIAPNWARIAVARHASIEARQARAHTCGVRALAKRRVRRGTLADCCQVRAWLKLHIDADIAQIPVSVFDRAELALVRGCGGATGSDRVEPLIGKRAETSDAREQSVQRARVFRLGLLALLCLR